MVTILQTNSWLQSYILITEWEQIQMGYPHHNSNPNLTYPNQTCLTLPILTYPNLTYPNQTYLSYLTQLYPNLLNLT